MEQLSAIKTKIHEIGRQMVDCDEGCDGIGNNKGKGILPRCLIYEIDRRTTDRGSVIIGINPGRSGHNERQFYVDNGRSYDQVLDYWDKRIRKVRYYTGLRRLVDQLGLDGPILWTELVKCENGIDNKLPPLQTRRTCTGTYLNRELQLIPDNWPIVAVGKEAYKALAYLHPNRVVIGIPHPTASRGQFAKLFEREQLRKEFRISFDDWWDGKIGKAGWADTREGQSGYR